MVAESDARCCAERRLLAAAERQARSHGAAAHQVGAWIRRKHGGDVVVWRETLGTLGISTPCIMCRRELGRLGMRVHAVVADGGVWFHGRLSDAGAPQCKPTSGQRRLPGFARDGVDQPPKILGAR